MRLVSRKFANIIDSIIFHTPTWKIRPSIEDISHLPIRILKISQIHSEFGERRPPIRELLSGLEIERLVLDDTSRSLDPNKLIKFQNIVHISSQVFERGKIFPLFLINKLAKLETFHCRRKTFMNFNEFKCLHKKSVSIPALHYWDYVTISNFSFNEYTLSKIFQDNGNNNVYCRISILIHLTKDPPKQLQFLQNTSL